MNDPRPRKNMCISFLINDTLIGVQGCSTMTIEKLIKNFRCKLCNDEIQFDKFIIESTNIELDPTSTETLSSKGITQDTKIIALTK